MTTDMTSDEIKLGRAYVFTFPWHGEERALELTGVAVARTGKAQWVTLRTLRHTFSVPPEDVVKLATPHTNSTFQ